ncbi:MAG: SH3 domain-containing protein [Rhodothermales bacterium]
MRARLVLCFGIVACLFAPVASAQSGAPSRSSTSSETMATGQQVGYLLADKVYAKPDAFSEEVSSITRDDQVRITPVANQEGWYEVYKVGESVRAGFAFRPYVSRFGSAGLASYKPEENRRTGGERASADEPLSEVVFAAVPAGTGAIRIVNEWANVRVGPGMNYEAFGVVRPGVPFQVLAVDRGWGKVRLTGERETGYVSAALFHALPDPEPAPVAAPIAEEAVRSAVIGGVAGGGAEGQVENTQAEALREVLAGSGVNSEATVYVTRTGRKFHLEGCKHLRSRTFAIPLAEAMLDYSPCRTCKPLQPREAEGDGTPEGENAPDDENESEDDESGA